MKKYIIATALALVLSTSAWSVAHALYNGQKDPGPKPAVQAQRPMPIDTIGIKHPILPLKATAPAVPTPGPAASGSATFETDCTLPPRIGWCGTVPFCYLCTAATDRVMNPVGAGAPSPGVERRILQSGTGIGIGTPVQVSTCPTDCTFTPCSTTEYDAQGNPHQVTCPGGSCQCRQGKSYYTDQ